MRGQLSIDLLFAITLISLTVVSLVNLATHEVEGAKTFDTSSKLKVFAVDLRDTVTKVYAVGDGFAVRKSSPFNLEGTDYVMVLLNQTSNELVVRASIDGKTYVTVQKIPVPLVSNSTVVLTPLDDELWIVCEYNQTVGGLDVKVKANP